MLIRLLKHRFEGFHFHYGSETNSIEDYKKHVARIINLCRSHALNIRTLDMGGGIHCIDRIGMESYLAWLVGQFPKHTRFIFELGRALSENAGVILGRVRNRHQEGKILNIVTTISPTCHLRWANPIILENQNGEDSALDYQLNVMAPTFYESDRLRPIAISRSMADSLKTGSSIRFRNISGYSWALNTDFNGIPKASIRFFESS